MRDVGLYTSIPIMLAVGPALGWYLGRLAENRWGGDPWWELGGVLLGLAASIRAIYKILKEGSSG
jgi:hypothetical protein